MIQNIVPYDIGCEPSPSDSGEVLVQDGQSTFLLFCAVSQTVQASGYLEDLGVALLECIGCVGTKFGYPNDEGLPEHPLYAMGLDDAVSSVLEILDSEWAQEMESQMQRSADRIWGSSRSRISNRPPPRHFIICLKNRTFECLADQMIVQRYEQKFSAAFWHVHDRFITY